MKCKNCRFSSDDKNIPETHRTHVECRFNPPAIVEGHTESLPSKAMLFPRIRMDAWCGKFEPKAA